MKKYVFIDRKYDNMGILYHIVFVGGAWVGMCRGLKPSRQCSCRLTHRILHYMPGPELNKNKANKLAIEGTIVSELFFFLFADAET